MMDQGLAQQEAQGQGGGMDQQQMMQLVQQVAQLLSQGVSPDELIQQGVPQEVIQAAMQMVQSNGAGEEMAEGQPPMGMQGERGLAAQSM